jgi:hypothetical protein
MHKTCTTTHVERRIGPYLLGAFTKLRKATIGIVMSVCSSVCPHGKTTSHWVEFHEILHFSIFRKFAEKIKISLKSNKHKILRTFISRYRLLRMRNVSAKSYRENEKYILCTVDKIMWKNMVQRDRPQMKI